MSTALAQHYAPVAPSHALPQQIVRGVRAQLANFSGGLAADDYVRAWWDWCLNLSAHPEQQLALAQEFAAYATDSWKFAWAAAADQALTPGRGLAHEHGDARFADPAWNQWPFNTLVRGYANLAKASESLLASAEGMSADNAQRLEFMQRQVLEAASPANFLPTNPELQQLTRAESGANLQRGLTNWLEDAQRMLSGGALPGTENFRVGEQVAVSPGKVVMRNALIELIQYSPLTETVHAEPILILPAWIMKYYILDLSPRNSLVRYLVDKGHTVFMVSWRNPTAADRELGMEDYVQHGLGAALDAVTRIVPDQRVHTVGYCIGGTLLSIAAAALAREGDSRIASMTLLAAQTDFSEPGELSVFISPSQLATLDALMQRTGVLGSERMGAAFAMLRASDLIWTPAVNHYLRGQRGSVNDLMAWNADGTRMPCRMHSEYLTRLYLRNELSAGTFSVAGQAVDLRRISVPMFVVGTETDHVAPWQSAFKTRGLTRSADYTFLLTSGGHNAGIISGPINPKRRHRTFHWTDAQSQMSPEQYLDAATLRPGSWWPTWQEWLAGHSTAGSAPPVMGNSAAGFPPLCDAPGGYVRG